MVSVLVLMLKVGVGAGHDKVVKTGWIDTMYAVLVTVCTFGLWSELESVLVKAGSGDVEEGSKKEVTDVVVTVLVFPEFPELPPLSQTYED